MLNFNKIKKFLLDAISFNTPQAIVFNITSAFLILAAVPTQMLQYLPLKCIFKNYLIPLFFHGNCPSTGLFEGCNCPACGMTRGMSRLLHGDFVGAYGYNKLVFVLFFIMFVVLIINIVKIYNNKK